MSKEKNWFKEDAESRGNPLLPTKFFQIIKFIFLGSQKSYLCVCNHLNNIEQHNFVQSFFPSHTSYFWPKI